MEIVHIFSESAWTTHFQQWFSANMTIDERYETHFRENSDTTRHLH